MTAPDYSAAGKSPLRAGSAVATARIFSLVAAAIQLPLLTRIMDVDEYALVGISIAAATYFSLASAESFILPFQRHPGHSQDRRNFKFAFVRVVAGSVAVGAIVVGVAFLIGFGSLGLAITGWGIGIAITRLASTAWLGWHEPWKYALNLMVSTGVRTVLLVTLALSGWEAAHALAVAGIGSAVAALVLSPRLASSQSPLEPPWTVRFGVLLALASLFITILLNANLLILPAFANSASVGRYAAMAQIGSFACGAVLGLVTTVLYPRLRSAWDSGNHLLVRSQSERTQQLAIAVGLGTLVLLRLGDGWLVGIIVGAAYVDLAVLPGLVLAPAFAAMGTVASWEHQFMLAGRRIAQRTAISALSGLASTVILATLYGTVGASVGAALGFFLYFALMSLGNTRSVITDGASLASLSLVTLFAMSEHDVSMPIHWLIFAAATGCALLSTYIIRGLRW